MTRPQAVALLLDKFTGMGIDDALAEARHSVAWLENCELLETTFAQEISANSEEKLKKISRRRSTGEPLAYILGERYFMGLRFLVSEHVLIPRQDTETLCERAISLIKMKKYNNVLDMCTGSGAVAISLAHYTSAKICASDVSQNALCVAKHNADSNGADITFIKSNLFENIKHKFDMITANPPYIRTSDYNELQCTVKDFEPEIALHAPGDGLCFYENIIRKSPEYLKENGTLALEIGHDQGEAVRNIMTQTGFDGVTVEKDLSDRDRLVYGNIRHIVR